MKKKLNLYVDGFNLYHGLRKHRGKFKWLDLTAVAQQLCKADEEVGTVNYFTARISGPDKMKIRRQNVYLEALVETGVNITHGKFKLREWRCPVCGKTYKKYEEKESDVNLGTILLVDSAAQAAHTMAIVSGDSDLILPMIKARDVYGRNVLPVFPPNRYSTEIQQRLRKFFKLGRTLLRDCQLPDAVTKADGYTLYRPKKWR